MPDGSIEVPGHTLGHIALIFDDDRIAFVGDTLFAMGCGRLFEGTAEQMFGSLQRLAALPDETALYCGHEYTLANAHFAAHAEPDNPAVADAAGRGQACAHAGGSRCRRRSPRNGRPTPSFALRTPRNLRACGQRKTASVKMRGALSNRRADT